MFGLWPKVCESRGTYSKRRVEGLDFARLGSAASCRGCGQAQCVPVAGANRADGRPLVAGQDLAECRKPYELLEPAGTPDTRTPLRSRGCPPFARGGIWFFFLETPEVARMERASENQRQGFPVHLGFIQGRPGACGGVPFHLVA